MALLTRNPIGKLFAGAVRWVDNEAPQGITFGPEDRKVSHLRLLPFWILHLPVLCVPWVGASPVAVGVAAALYFVRMFAITGWYHRYFSHRTFKTGRAMQFIFAFIGNSAAQRGALHWAAHHRNHHRFSDRPEDPHSPRQHGFWVSHMLWFGKKENAAAQSRHCKDFAKFPELMFLDRFDFLAPICLGAFTLGLGWLLRSVAPQLGTSGPQMLIWGFFVSTIALYHGTFSINSLGHVLGRQRYRTGDDSKNSLLLALITLGEGWHNNHHHYANTVRQGFRWWEIDVSFYLLWGFSKLGLVWGLKPVPRHLLRDASGPDDWTPVPAPADAVPAAERDFSEAA
ncbi:MAG TPA: acyl-CoA desaturase [Fibrobacteria bacterium]|nr:acyl-CoA desaturase [Fibrobacteria bacterium]